jgi:hypothetical protein
MTAQTARYRHYWNGEIKGQPSDAGARKPQRAEKNPCDRIGQRKEKDEPALYKRCALTDYLASVNRLNNAQSSNPARIQR